MPDQPASLDSQKTKPKAVPAHPPALAAPKPAASQLNLVNETASSVSATPEKPVTASPDTAAPAQTAPIMESELNRKKENIPALPLHAQLRFAVYLNGSHFSIGDLFQELNIKDGRYTLQAELEKAGLASWFNSTQITQSSSGILSANGNLIPEEFKEERTDAQGAHHVSDVAFDWTNRKMRFADGTESPLPPGAQDKLGFLYQLSQFSFNTEIIPLALTDGTKLENIRLEVGMREDIITPMGKLHTLHLQMMPDEGAAGMEIWLGLDYHMLPLKFRQIEPGGKISEELAIKEIRLSDEQPTK